MSILTDWTEINAATTVVWGTVSAARQLAVSPAWGMFGNGMQVVSSTNPELNNTIADWSGIRFNDFTIPLDGTKIVISAVFLIPRIGNSGQFSIAGVGLISSTSSAVNNGMTGLVVLDGRNGLASNVSSTAFQIRNKSISSAEVVYGAEAPAGSLQSTDYYRIEYEINTTAQRSNLDVIARWYRHSTNELLHTANVTIDKPAAGVSLRPCALVYRDGRCDNVQIQVGEEPYLPNMPVRTWNGTSWVRKPIKKMNSDGWVPVYAKAFKANQWVW